MAKNLEDILNGLNGQLINFDKHRQSYTAHYNELRNQLYSLLKSEKILGKLLKGSTLGGSYGDNLKVSMPNEFDLVIHLVFPENDRIIVKPDPSKPGNVTLDMTKMMEAIRNSEHHRPIYEQLQKLVNGKNMLLEDRLQNWLQSVMTQTLNKMGNQIEVNKSISTLKYKKCGPAHTIVVKGPYEYSVDFVPGIKLSAAQSVLAGEQKKHFGQTTHWDAIPKPLKPPKTDNNSFRASYYDAEHVLLKDKGNLKNAVRLLKKFRDTKQNLGNLKSYYIKTVFLWEVTKRDRRYWQSPLHEIFIEMMIKLANSLYVTPPNKRKLLFFWHPNLDLIADLSSTQRENIFDCLAKGIYHFTKGAGNLTVDIMDRMHSSFSNREERGIEKKPAKPKPNTNCQICEKKEVATQCESKLKDLSVSNSATQKKIATPNPELGAKMKASLPADEGNPKPKANQSLPGMPASNTKPKPKVQPNPIPKMNTKDIQPKHCQMAEKKTEEAQSKCQPKLKENPDSMPNPQLDAKKKTSLPAGEGNSKPKANGSLPGSTSNRNLKPDVTSSSNCVMN